MNQKKLFWILVMLAIFLLTLAAVLGKVTPVLLNQLAVEQLERSDNDKQRIQTEKLLSDSVDDWRPKLELLESEIRSSPLFSTKRSYLKKSYRELKSDWRLVRKQLRELREASQKDDWEHLADHLQANLDRMEQIFKSRR